MTATSVTSQKLEIKRKKEKKKKKKTLIPFVGGKTQP
jgi:hypothetical protein